MDLKTQLTLPITFLFIFSSVAFSQVANDKPKLNQLGFYPEAPKIAITPESDAATFHLREAATGSVVYQGFLEEAESYSLTGETVKVADFSDYTTPGTYFLLVDGGQQSYDFEIRDDVHDELSSGLIKALYFNRASVSLPEEHAGPWARPAGHPDTSVIVHTSAATANRPANSTIASPGGWYDAGDLNKYVVPISSSISHMLFAYEQFPDFFNQRELNIPESGDNIPDLLDEALFALRWLLTMQDPDDGGVYNKLTHANFQATIMPHQATDERYVVQKGTTATLDFAAVMAQAARVYETLFPDFADSALAAAEYAWEWAEANPGLSYDQAVMNENFNPDINTGGYGDSDFSDEWFWASSELYVTTKKEDYYDSGGWSGVGVSGWGNVRALGLYSLIHHRKELTAAGLSDTTAMKQAMIENFDWYANDGNSSPYRSVFGIADWQFYWGSNGVAGNLGMALLFMHEFSGNSKYYDAALHVMDYVLGRNGVGYSYVTGFGDQTPRNIHHRQSQADGVSDPVPGWVAGGPNPHNQEDCGSGAYNSSKPALAFLDNYCSYSTNEVTTYWNSPFIYLAAGLEHFTPEFNLTSDNPFTFISPVSDSLYERGTEITIEWTAEDINSVDILYKVFTDTEYTEIETGLNSSDGSFTGFEIPDLPGDSLIFRIRDSENTETYIQSSAIKIKPLRSISIVSVETRAEFSPDRRVYIEWNSVIVDSIDILYKLSFEEDFTFIASVEAAKKSYEQFRVPDYPGDSLTIRLQDSETDTVFAESDPILIVTTVSNEQNDNLPDRFVLEQNYPNPFNPSTIISYQIPESGRVKLEIFDMLGKKISSLVDGRQTAGTYSVSFDAANLSSGIYIYKLVTDKFTSTKKMLLIK